MYAVCITRIKTEHLTEVPYKLIIDVGDLVGHVYLDNSRLLSFVVGDVI